jgi:hypothetical protein
VCPRKGGWLGVRDDFRNYLVHAASIEEALDRTDLVEADIARLERIGERLLTISACLPPSVYTIGVLDWLTSALNHPAGEVAMAWIKAVSKRRVHRPASE